MSGGDLLEGLIKLFAPPFLLICIAVAAFAYYVSVGKKRLGIVLGVVFVLAAGAYFGSFFLN
ncbi:MAG: hypothetical protein JWM00_559 [Candidatus Saccharibacteria bacterium]|nr:hypothetical protein [Candidatus Saccharibacteria bacterium]